MIRAFKLLFLLLFTTGIPSCCNFKEPTQYEVFLDAIVIQEIARINARGIPETYRPGDTLEAEKEFLLKVEAITERKEISQLMPLGNGLFTTAAYACSPPPVPRDKLAYPGLSLSIISPYDYDERHPAGTDLSPLFQVQSRSDSSFRRLPDLFTEDPLQVIRQFPELRLSQSPAQISRQVFEIRLRTADTTFRARTPPVILK